MYLQGKRNRPIHSEKSSDHTGNGKGDFSFEEDYPKSFGSSIPETFASLHFPSAGEVSTRFILETLFRHFAWTI